MATTLNERFVFTTFTNPLIDYAAALNTAVGPSYGGMMLCYVLPGGALRLAGKLSRFNVAVALFQSSATDDALIVAALPAYEAAIGAGPTVITSMKIISVGV